MIGLSISCASRNLVGGVLMIDTTTFNIESLEKIESRSFYFDGVPTKNTFKTQNDRDRWESYREDPELELGKFLEYLISLDGITILAHSTDFELKMLDSLFSESLALLNIARVSINLVQIGEFINVIYNDSIYEYQSFDHYCEVHNITKGNKSQKQLRIYRKMVEEVNQDVNKVKTTPSVGSTEPCYYCGATTPDPLIQNCFLCGRVSLPIAWVEFIGEFKNEHKELAKSLELCDKFESTSENTITLTYSKKYYYDYVMSYRKVALNALAKHFGFVVELGLLLK